MNHQAAKNPTLNHAGKTSVVVLLVWAVAVSVPIIFLTAAHSVPLPTRPVTASGTKDLSAAGRWQAVHILVADCPCSEFTAHYLAGRGVRPELQERVWIVGGQAPWESQLAKAGFAVEHREAEQVAEQFGIQGGPWLQLISPIGQVAYSGGYAPHRPASSNDFCDLQIWMAVSNGSSFRVYPAYGCAASRWLQKTIDPLGMSYTKPPEKI